MKVFEIKEIGINKEGLLYIRPLLKTPGDSSCFDYVYRAAMGVYWNKEEKYFHSNLPAIEEMSYERWHKQILQAVKEELGVSLEISKDTIWSGISKQFEKFS